MILLQAVTQVNVTDVTFRMMDMVYIVLGTITIIGAISAFRNSITKINDRIDNEVKAGKTEFKHLHEKHTSLEARVLDTENSIDNVEKNIDSKIEKVYDLLRTVTNNINEMERKILERLLNNK